MSAGATAYDVEVGRRLRWLRRQRRWTLQNLADVVGMTSQQIHHLEVGKGVVYASALFALAQALEADVSYFYDGMRPYSETLH